MEMGTPRQMMHLSAGKVGVIVGLATGFVATLMGGTGKALFCAGLFALWAYVLRLKIHH